VGTGFAQGCPVRHLFRLRYEVIPVNRAGGARMSGGRLLVSQESFKFDGGICGIFWVTPKVHRLAVAATAPGCSLSGDGLHSPESSSQSLPFAANFLDKQLGFDP
jgi:hypothetical protein